jgi:hypothetical protein
VIEVLAANKGVEGKPVNLAEPGQSGRVARGLISSGQNKGPESIRHLGLAKGCRKRFS